MLKTTTTHYTSALDNKPIFDSALPEIFPATLTITADTLSVAGKVGVVTGSGCEDGIRADIVTALAHSGAAVTINYVSDSSAERLNSLPNLLMIWEGELLRCKRRLTLPKKLEGFEFNHAGIGEVGETLYVTPEDINRILDVNVKGAISACQAAVPHMPPGGRVINISSTSSKQRLDGLPIYGASKAALDSLTWSWSKEWGRSRGIIVNSVAPGPVAIDIVPAELVDELMGPQKNLTRATDRLGTPEDLGDAVLLLVFERARWITGQYISVSGGITGN